jgi:hypothetical protein
MGGLGLDLDSRRISPAPPSVLESVSPQDAFLHLAKTGVTSSIGTAIAKVREPLIPSLNRGEQAQIATRSANLAMDDVFGVGRLSKNDKLTLHVMGKEWFGNGSGVAPAPEGMFPQILQIPSRQSAVMGAAPILNALNRAYGGLSSQDIIQLYNPGAIPQTLDPDAFAPRVVQLSRARLFDPPRRRAPQKISWRRAFRQRWVSRLACFTQSLRLPSRRLSRKALGAEKQPTIDQPLLLS